MKWHEISISTTSEASDAITEMLTSIGAGGVAIEDPNDIKTEILKPNSLDYVDEEFLKKLGEDVVIKSYFPEDTNLLELLQTIKEKIEFISEFLPVGKGSISSSEIDEEDFANSWKKYFKPFNVSEKIVIKPSWEEYFPKDGEIIIEMDPGMAFGTGTHETTMLCTRFIEKYLKAGDRALDVGSGTGILSIVAAKLGANEVVAVDIDDIAVRVTKENCTLNHVEDKITAIKGVAEDVKNEKFDIIFANIIATVIIDIAKVLSQCLEDKGVLVVSGIIKERRQEVIDAYMKLGYSCLDVCELGEWVAIVFKCQSSL